MNNAQHTATTKQLARPAQFIGYGFSAMIDEVKTYRVGELRELLAEMGINTQGMSAAAMMVHALEALWLTESK